MGHLLKYHSVNVRAWYRTTSSIRIAEMRTSRGRITIEFVLSDETHPYNIATLVMKIRSCILIGNKATYYASRARTC